MKHRSPNHEESCGADKPPYPLSTSSIATKRIPPHGQAVAHPLLWNASAQTVPSAAFRGWMAAAKVLPREAGAGTA